MITASLDYSKLAKALIELDRQDKPYHFVVNNIDGYGIHLVCMCDGSDVNGLTITLQPGTWEAIIDVNIGVKND